MFKLLSKLLFIITIAVAFIGQTMAYHIMPSFDDMSELHTKVFQQAVENNDHDMNTSDDDCCEIDCCETECICPANACASFTYLDNNTDISELVILSEQQLSLATKSTHFIANSLYRPPIFTS
ncbi:hypothetical protein [Pseudoalteromonas sp. '520P1 No. 412']|uniref:hypothetical protein n=2 Tax=unclassified Pseudoalteromonas TaxID=194690 RepID=UPI0005A85B06|nr:hypothetical protein [Pseudoalteromonas sp. '520P1 No. 412']